jgi:peptide/nickel transport system substrate-binding protein
MAVSTLNGKWFSWRKLRHTVRLVVAFLLRYKLVVGSMMLVGVGLFLVFPSLVRLIPRSRGVERIGVVGVYPPENLPINIQEQVSMGLTTIADDGSVKPGLAKSWQAEEEGKVWEFELGDDYFWHDNESVKAGDVDYRFNQVEAEADGDKTIKFKLEDNYSPFPAVVAKPVFREELMGVGPYKLKKSVNNGGYLSYVNLVPRSDESLIPDLVYKFYRTEQAARLGFKLGEVDEVDGVMDPKGFEYWKNVKVEEQAMEDAVVVLMFNNRLDKLANKSVRQALAYGIEDKSFGRERVLGPIARESWAYNPLIKNYNYDADKAGDLLKEEEGGGEMEMKLVTIGSLLPEAEKIAGDWGALGVNTEVQVINQIPDDFEAMLVIQQIPKDPDQYVLWHSTQETNLSGFKDPRVDRLLEMGRKELSKEKRKEIYHDFQRYLLEDSPAVFLFKPVNYNVVREG